MADVEVAFLSDEWIVAFDELVRHRPLAPGDATEPAATLRIAHVVTDGPSGQSVAYSLELGPDGGQVRSGRGTEPTVTFTTDYATAAAVSRGDEQTQSVFLDGRLRVGGDTAALLAARRSLAAIGDVAAELRRRTTYPTVPAWASRA